MAMVQANIYVVEIVLSHSPQSQLFLLPSSLTDNLHSPRVSGRSVGLEDFFRHHRDCDSPDMRDGFQDLKGST